MEISCGLTYDKVRVDQDTEAHLVLSIRAPAMQADHVRPRLALILCIDVSGSMGGPKLEQAKQSAVRMVDHLRSDDFFGLVTFGSDVKVVTSPAVLGGRKADVQKAVSGLRADGMTNFSGGMIKSLTLLQELDLGTDVIHRVVMLTDGAANAGPARDPENIIKLLTANRGHVTCSAFGYGSGTDFSPTFLTDFAREGKGNYAHIEGPEGALKAFGVELGGLISTYATDIRLEVTPVSGHMIERVVSDVAVSEESTGEIYVDIPDILAEETRHIVCAVKLTRQSASGPRSVNVFDVKATFQTFDSLGKRENHVVTSRAKVQFVKDGDQDTKPNESLDQIVGLAQLIRAQLEAEALAKRGSFAAAERVMNTQTQNFTSRGRSRLATASANLAGRLGSSGAYASNQGYLRSFANGGTRGVGVASYVSGSDQLLNDLGMATSTATTNATSHSFSGDPGDAGLPAGSAIPDVLTQAGGFISSLMKDVPPDGDSKPVSTHEAKRKPLRQTRKSSW